MHERDGLGAALVGSALLVMLGISVRSVAAAWINHDAAWYLHVAGGWLQGATLYRDLVDTNPPLIIFLSAIPVWLGRVMTIPPTALFKALLLMLAVAALVPFYLALRSIYATRSAAAMVTATAAFFLLAFPGGDFGQREQITVLLVLPYVLTSCLTVAGHAPGLRTSVVSGVLAGIGFALKPHFLLPLVLAELVTMGGNPRGRPWHRPSAAAIVLTMLVYGVTVLVFAPAFLQVAQDVMQVYGGLDAEPVVLLKLIDLRIWVGVTLAFGWLWLPPAHRQVALLLLAVATGFLGAGVAQMKGWPYHLYPWRFFLALFVAFVSASIFETLVRKYRVASWILPAAAAVGGVLLVLATLRAAPRTTRPSGIEQVAALETTIRTTRAESMAVLSMRTILFPAFPAVNYTGVRWVMRHHSMWFLPGLYADQMKGATGEIRGRPPGQMDALEGRYFGAIVSDLCAEPPRLLLIEPPLPNRPGNPPSLDLVAYYEQDPGFARMWDGYSLHSRFGPFEVYVRGGEVSCGAH